MSDETGQLLIYFTLLIPVVFGMIGLSLDAGRVLLLNNQLQDLADAAALAGAKELDGGSDAIARATNAAENLLTNDTWWSNVAFGGTQIVDPPVFYSALKGVPVGKPGSSDVPTDDPTQAAYIKVTTVTRQVAPIFLAALGIKSLGRTNATATAGSSYVACDVHPLMLCNPFEAQGMPFSARAGQQFHMTVLNEPRPEGGHRSFAPGDLALLDPPGMDSTGANTIRNLLSQQSPNFCYISGVTPRTGLAAQKVDDGIGVRFDIPVIGNIAGLDRSPAPDVVKGLLPPTGHECIGQYTDLGPYARFPRDSNWTTIGNVQMGNGTLRSPDKDNYWQYHFGANWPMNHGVPLTRYQAYQQELNLASKPGTEIKAPLCAAATDQTNLQRRIIDVAVIDCMASGVRDNATATIAPGSYAEFFVTEPPTAVTRTSGEIWAEFVRMVTPQTEGNKLHQIVQLYRDR